MDDSLQKRGHALEELFFQKQNQMLLEQMRKQLENEAIRETLVQVTGIEDVKVIDHIAEAGITGESIVALSLVPLLFVAWADGVVQPNEKEAILKAAAETNIDQGSLAYQLLESWLKHEPAHDLLDAWKEYIREVRRVANVTAFNQIKATVLRRADDVAKSAGGFLGMAAISVSEQKVLDELAQAFDA
ncbi:MAG: hypothetical protein KF851_02450 [Pirellulaceae bacterium]|nr:hypothetical protein [Pirellulaceae bacterium]